jgi:hypothetical protein
MTTEVITTTPADTATETAAGPTELEQARRSLKRWRIAAIALMVAVVLGLLGSCALVLLVSPFSPALELLGGGMNEPDQTAKLKASIKKAYKSDLESVTVKRVKDPMGAPFPYSFLEGGGHMYEVQYRLKGSDVPFAGVLYDPSMSTIGGFIPPQGSLKNRMPLDRLYKLMAAYKAETSEPLGGVTRYGSEEMMMEAPSSSVPETLTVDGKDYPTEQLWMAREGLTEAKESAIFDGGQTNALVFFEDPKTGEFVYVGTEPTFSPF